MAPSRSVCDYWTMRARRPGCCGWANEPASWRGKVRRCMDAGCVSCDEGDKKLRCVGRQVCVPLR